MAESTTVIVTEGSLQVGKWQLCLSGHGDPGIGPIVVDSRLNRAEFHVERVVVKVGDASSIDLGLAHAVEIPGGLIHIADPGGWRLKTGEELEEELKLQENLRARFEAVRSEAIRRLSTLEVDVGAGAFVFLGVQNPESSANVIASARVKLYIEALVVPGASAVRTMAELALVIEGKSEATGFAVAQTLALSCLFRQDFRADPKHLPPALRIDVDDFNIGLPEFELPALSVVDGGLLATLSDQGGAPWIGAARLLERLATSVNARFTSTTTTPGLAMRVRPNNRGFDWAVVRERLQPEDWDALEFGGKLAEFDVSIEVQSNLKSIGFAGVKGLRLGGRANELFVAGDVTASAEFDLPDGQTRVGPLEVTWFGVRIKPAVKSGEDLSLRAEVDFERLTLRLHDDHDATLSFRGAAELTPSSAQVLWLDLVAPHPIVLIPRAMAALARRASSILRVVADFANATGAQIQKLFEILVKMAVAAGQAAVFVAGDAVAAAGELLTRGLTALSELVSEVLRALGKLAAAGSSRFAVELRIGTDPFELRQILVTLRGGGVEGSVVAVLGMQIEVKDGWQPGLLLDLVTRPGAYMIATREAASGQRKIATISTDLWLKRATITAPVRDIDGGQDPAAAGAHVDKPLIAVDLGLKSGAAKDVVVVLAGLSRGRGVFLKQLAGETESVTAPVALPGTPGVVLKTASGPMVLTNITADLFELDVNFEKDRILPLLGMGEPGKEKAGAAGPGFLARLQGSLANVLWVKETRTFARVAEREAQVDLILGLKAAGLETSVTLQAMLSLDTFEVELDADDTFSILSGRIEERALGLTWVVEQLDPEVRIADTAVEMFRLSLVGGQSGFELNTKAARMLLRFDGLSSDGEGVVFAVKTFKIGPGGLDLKADVMPEPVRLNGIDVPFRFTSGSLEIKAGKLVAAAISGRGSLPPQLIGDADCTIALVFGEGTDGDIILQSGKVALDKIGDPIVCAATRFTLTIQELGIDFVHEDGYHFFFLVTGSLRFTPGDGEFEAGLLQFLDGVTMDLERIPLSSDPRVLLKHISFQKALNPKKTFNLFNLFTFELRGFGYHPAASKFGGDPAVNLSGQIKFAEIGDVMQPEIDFHGLWIAPPRKGQSLPRIKADGLGIGLNLKGAIKVKGTVIAVDAETTTVEGAELAPPGYNTYGFLGRGEFEIPGWGSLAASLGFLEVERKERPGERRKSFYFFAEKRKLAIEIPTPIWTFYLREAGFGLGFRYTLEALSAGDQASSVPQLIHQLDEVAKRQGDLHKFSAWRPEPEGDRVTLALKGAIQPNFAAKKWNEAQEEAAESPFLFDLVAAIRSDFTLFMGLRGWLATNYADYLNDKDGLRSNPGLIGYLYISAPQKRLLARMTANSQGYIGERVPALKKGDDGKEPPLRQALRAVDWSATLFIKPGLFHYELGWPDQLVARLVAQPNLRVTVRGGMIFRAAEDGLLWAYNIQAEAFFKFAGDLRVGPVSLTAEASLEARFVARVLSYLSWRFKGSLIYGLIALDATLTVRVRATLEVNLRFTRFTIPISFSVSLQFSAAVELAISTGGVGARVKASVGVSAFGRTLSVSVGFTIGGAELDAARARVQRFLAMSITAEEPDAAPQFASAEGDRRIAADAVYAEAPHKAPLESEIVSAGTIPNTIEQHRSQLGRVIPTSDFWLVLHAAGAAPGGSPAPDDHVYATLVPKEPRTNKRGGFYAAPYPVVTGADARREDIPAHWLHGRIDTDLGGIYRYVPGAEFEPLGFASSIQGVKFNARWNMPAATDSPLFTLAHLFDECFLSDTKWEGSDADVYRVTTRWHEPEARYYGAAEQPGGATDQEKVASRDLAQRERAAAAAADPVVDGVHQARSTVLAMFVDQFTRLAETGVVAEKTAHVTDLGLVFYGQFTQVQALAGLYLSKFDGQDATAPHGAIEVLNRREDWFDRKDPILAQDRFVVATDGIKLDWRLTLPFVNGDPEQFLHHYEIVRTMERREFNPRTLRVKPATTIGGSEGMKVRLFRPEWQFVDDLSDIEPAVRRALLPCNEEAGALEGAIAWAETFGDEDAISVTYSVTPVDIAGARGLPKSFLVEILRPVAPIRPAEAVLRFVVTRLGEGRGAYHRGDPPADGLGVVMALHDPSFHAAPEEKGSGDAAVLITRKYRLIADPDDIRPSGHYGTDGLTERRLGSPSGFLTTADAAVWALDAAGFRTVGKPDTGELRELEPDADTRKKFAYWRALAGKTGLKDVDDWLRAVPPPGGGAPRPPAPPVLLEPPLGGLDFLRSLWRHGSAADGARIATRFALETVHEVHNARGKLLARFISKRVPVAVEVRVEPLVVARPGGAPRVLGEVGLSRPEAFEWPVHLAMPAHGPGQVRAETGFARYRVPPEVGGGLETLQTGKLALVRDPERRVLTTVSFDAAARFDGDSLPPVDSTHRTAVAGYDLHELDLDDLARLDTDANAFDCNAKTWRRARRVARIERVSPEMARLMPDANSDWIGWHAHYPSETWRLAQRGLGTAGRSTPIRAPWYSPAESTLHFAERVPRLRLLVTVPELSVSDLLRTGSATALVARMRIAADKDRDPWLTAAIEDATLSLCDLGDVPWRSTFTEGRRGFLVAPANKTQIIALTPSEIRAVLLRLVWAPDTDICNAYRQDPGLFVGLSVEIEGKAHVTDRAGKPQTDSEGRPLLRSTGTTSVPVDPGSFRHPLLEEVLGELEYEGSATALYRRYVVTPQTVQPGEDREFAGFLASTAADQDPYGWHALQCLGLATTIRMYDRDRDEFLDASRLLARADVVMKRAITRYACAYGPVGVGQPIVEVLLKPGRDRVRGPFDAVLEAGSVEDEPGAIDLADDGLALAQLSLRPRIVAGRRYSRLCLGWAIGRWPSVLRVDKLPPESSESGTGHAVKATVTEYRLRGYVVVFARLEHLAYEVLRAADGLVVRIPPRSEGDAALPGVPIAVLGRPADTVTKIVEDLSLRFFVRHADGLPAAAALVSLGARVATITRMEADGPGAVDPHGSPAMVEEQSEQTVSLADLWNLYVRDPAPEESRPKGSGLCTPGAIDIDFAPAFTAVASPADLPSPHERFGALKPDEWTAMTVPRALADSGLPGTPTRDDAPAVGDGLESLRQNLRATVPDLVWPRNERAPTVGDFQAIMSGYLDWSQRFLDHTASPVACPWTLTFALAAPIKGHPWQLAADHAGQITLSFLHSDRWAHTRAYAVRPTGRYENLALGAGYYDERQEDSERLVTPELVRSDELDVFRQPIGYALAVSPRTERIEPPVILGTGLTSAADGKRWELVVARHGEEALAFSNRSLFARLGTEGTALSFVREYREPAWPERLKHTNQALPSPVLYPVVEPATPVVPTRTSTIDGAALGVLAQVHPSLWQGADIWRFGGLPSHYRVTVLAVARAGLVVSRVVTAVQDATPRRPLSAPDQLGKPRFAVEQDGEKVLLTVRDLRLVSHQDLSEVQPSRLRDDIAWWPDPAVTYSLLRHGPLDAGTFEDEDATVHLVARADPAIEHPGEAEPVVVRCRGTRFTLAVPAPTVRTSEVGDGREFLLDLWLAPTATGPASRKQLVRLVGEPAGRPPRDAFNAAAQGFAELSLEYEIFVSVGVAFPDDVAAARLWLANRVTEVELLVGDIEVKKVPEEQHLCALLTELAAEFVAASASLTLAKLPETRARITRPRRFTGVSADAFDAAKLPTSPLTIGATFTEVLALRRLPTDALAAAVVDSLHPVAKTAGGALWRYCRRMLLGAATGIKVRAVDTRSVNDTVGDAVIETELELPDWAVWGAQEE